MWVVAILAWFVISLIVSLTIVKQWAPQTPDEWIEADEAQMRALREEKLRAILDDARDPLTRGWEEHA